MKRIAVIEGNHQGLVRQRNGQIYGAAEGFADCLASLDPELSFTIVRPHFETHHYTDSLLDNCDGVVFTGSANSWSADDKEAEPARQMMQLALSSKKPVFGSCYGLQLAVAVLGGKNRSHPIETEFAIARDITLTKAGKSHPLYQGKAGQFDARCMHRDEIASLPTGAVGLSQNAHSPYQAMAYEQGDICFWGVQYHPELDFADIAHFIAVTDVESFSDAQAFAAKLSLSADTHQLMTDFNCLDDLLDDAALIAKYQLTENLTNTAKHRCELANFLKLI